MSEPLDKFCVCRNTISQGRVPCVDDGDHVLLFDTERQAQHAVVDCYRQRLQSFVDGNMEFEDAMMRDIEIIPVTLHEDGCFTDEDGNTFRLPLNEHGDPQRAT